MSSVSSLTFTQQIQASPENVYHAFTNAAVLQTWFADLVEADASENGHFYAWWNGGFYTTGLFTEVVPGKKVAFSWHARWEPAPTQVVVVFDPQDGGTRLTLTHSGLGEGETWERVAENYKREWPSGLGNLVSVLEKGVDQRQFNRPMLGFYLGGLNNDETAKDLGVPVSKGIVLSGVIDGLGAQKAGLQGNDVIVSISGKAIEQYQDVGQAIAAYKGGDGVEMVYYRGAEKFTAEVTLAQRPIPDFPPPPKEMAAQLRQLYIELDAELDAAVEGVTEAESAVRPAEGEWCVKEVLGHMIISERWGHMAVEATVSGQKSPGYPFKQIYAAIMNAYSLEELVAELKHCEAISIALTAAIPDEVYAQKARYFGIYSNMVSFIKMHNRGHYQQIKAAAEVARKA